MESSFFVEPHLYGIRLWKFFESDLYIKTYNNWFFTHFFKIISLNLHNLFNKHTIGVSLIHLISKGYRVIFVTEQHLNDLNHD
jgi:hypothetical protein